MSRYGLSTSHQAPPDLMDKLRSRLRFVSELPRFLRRTLTLEDARAIVRRRIEQREETFLRLMDQGVFRNDRSPYLPLLELAQVEPGDLDQIVRLKGLEPALAELRRAGVYFSFEEFKGRKPVIRDGRSIPIDTSGFDNALIAPSYSGTTSGSTGPATRKKYDLDYHFDMAPIFMLAHHAHGVLNLPCAVWRGDFPSISGLNLVLRQAPFRQIPERWFDPYGAGELRRGLADHFGRAFVWAASRLCGVPIPRSEPVRLDHADVVARWAAEAVASHKACLISTGVSRALRVCLAAKELGLDLTGTTFLGGGEPPTPAKVRGIQASGAAMVPNYWFSEVGMVGIGCARPLDTNDLHHLRDVAAIIQYPRQVQGTDITVDAFYFTTLLPTSPHLLLNVESDDYGLLENHSCSCPLEELGYHDHIRHVGSFQKLTGEGVTLLGTRMIPILEDVLPTQFGGSPLDYQIWEEEDDSGLTRLSLVVHPSVGPVDEARIIEVVLEALAHGSRGLNLQGTVWERAGTLRVKRVEPHWTGQSKLWPLHLAHHTTGGASSR